MPAEREDLSSRLTQASSAMQAMAAEKAAMLAEIERLRMQVSQVWPRLEGGVSSSALAAGCELLAAGRRCACGLKLPVTCGALPWEACWKI